MTKRAKKSESSTINQDTKNQKVPKNPDNKGDNAPIAKKPKNGKSKKQADKKPENPTKLEVRREKGLIPRRLPEKLRQIRSHLNLSQGKMLIAISPNETEENRARVSQWERGIRIPTVIEIRNYAKLVGISMEILVDDDTDLPFL